MKTLTCMDTKLNKGIYTMNDVRTVQFINGTLIVTYVSDGQTKTQTFTKESLTDDLFILIA